MWTADKLMYNGVSYDAAYSGDTLVWRKPTPQTEALTLKVVSGGTLGWGLVDATAQVTTQILYYSLNGGEWTELSTTTPLNVNSGDRLSVRHLGYGENYNIYGMHFYGTAYFKVYGNLLSLVYRDFSGKTSVSNYYNSRIQSIFQSSRVTDASQMALPVTTIPSYSVGFYSDMFKGCTSLTAAPQLPATTLAADCYAGMFEGCTSLTTAPSLPATSTSVGCYESMYKGCTSLVNAPQLYASTVTANAYKEMFSGCTSLVNAPALPATSLGNQCYRSMFEGCTSLTTAPELPNATLTSSSNQPYYAMFKDCTSLNYIKCLMVPVANDVAIYWTTNVSSNGTFVKAAAATWPSGSWGIPSGWTVVDT